MQIPIKTKPIMRIQKNFAISISYRQEACFRFYHKSVFIIRAFKANTGFTKEFILSMNYFTKVAIGCK